MSVLPRSGRDGPHDLYEGVEPGKARVDPAGPEDFCEYAYDFQTNELKKKDGKHYYVYGNEAIKIWIYKCMLSSRFRYSAYTDRFGTEVYDLIGEVISTKLKREEVKRYITEAIMVHPHITAITKMDLRPHKSGLEVTVWTRTIFEGEVEPVSCIVKI